MSFIVHTFSIGHVSLYCAYKPQSRLILLNINLLPIIRLELYTEIISESKIINNPTVNTERNSSSVQPIPHLKGCEILTK